MSKVRLLKRLDGTVSIVVPALKSRRRTPAKFIREILDKYVIEVSGVEFLVDKDMIIGQLPDKIVLYLETEQEFLDRVFTKMNPESLPYEDIDTADLPTDRDYRGAWEFDDVTKKVKVNQGKKNAQDAKKALKDSAKAKIINKAGLTQEEAEAYLS